MDFGGELLVDIESDFRAADAIAAPFIADAARLLPLWSDEGNGGEPEAARLEALYQLDILDTEAEQEYDDLTSLAAMICNTPMALFTLVDRDRQWVKSKIGLTLEQTPRCESICTHTIEQGDLFIVEDAACDARFCHLPLVREGIFRFYAGASVFSPDGYNVGSLCVLDTRPRKLTEDQKMALRMLARRAASNLLVRFQHKQLLQRLRDWLHAQEELRESKMLLEEANRKLQALATTDALTGLTNRRALDEYRRQEWKPGDASGLSVLMIDIDHFKRVNDTLSHEAGDHVLMRVAELLRACTRAVDTICRYGGEEFIVLMPGVDHVVATARAERLRIMIEGDRMGLVPVTVSVGIASRDRNAAGNLTLLLGEADRALYAAKQAGRNCVRSAAGLPVTEAMFAD
jgi:diguanylate cyclase (GGDEF)-like protein